ATEGSQLYAAVIATTSIHGIASARCQKGLRLSDTNRMFAMPEAMTTSQLMGCIQRALQQGVRWVRARAWRMVRWRGSTYRDVLLGVRVSSGCPFTVTEAATDTVSWRKSHTPSAPAPR